MKKLIFGVFAHPDDEAFGPSGTFLSEIAAGNDVHIITLTAGEAGHNPDGVDDIAAVRLQEWRECGKLLGASTMTQLGYQDGQLNNTSMEKVTEKIESFVRETIANSNAGYEFLVYDFGGISGHIDHIVASRATAAVYYRLKQSEHPPARLRLFCLPHKWIPEPDASWIYRDPGCLPEVIDEIIDAREHLNKIRQIIKTHHSQREDGAVHLAQNDEVLSLNHYRVIK